MWLHQVWGGVWPPDLRPVISCAPPQALKDGSSGEGGGARGRVPVCAPEEACLHGLLQGAKSTTQGGQVPTSSVSIATPSTYHTLTNTGSHVSTLMGVKPSFG